MTDNKYRGRSHDLRALDDEGNTSEATKVYAEMQARQAVSDIVLKYGSSVTLLKMVSHYRNQHVTRQPKTKEETDYERMKQDITRQVHRDLGLVGDNG